MNELEILRTIAAAVQKTGTINPSNIQFVQQMANSPDPNIAAAAQGILVAAGMDTSSYQTSQAATGAVDLSNNPYFPKSVGEAPELPTPPSTAGMNQDRPAVQTAGDAGTGAAVDWANEYNRLNYGNQVHSALNPFSGGPQVTTVPPDQPPTPTPSPASTPYTASTMPDIPSVAPYGNPYDNPGSLMSTIGGNTQQQQDMQRGLPFGGIPGADWLSDTGMSLLDPNFDIGKDPGLVMSEYLHATGQSPEMAQLLMPYVQGYAGLQGALAGGQPMGRYDLLGGLDNYVGSLETPGWALNTGDTFNQIIDPSNFAGNPLAAGAPASSPDYEYGIIQQGVQSLQPYLGDTAYQYLKARVDAAYLDWRRMYAENPGGVGDFATYLQGQGASGWTQ